MDLQHKVSQSTIDAYTSGSRKITANATAQVSKAWEIVKEDLVTHLVSGLILMIFGILGPFLMSGYYSSLYKQRKQNIKMEIISIFEGFNLGGKLVWVYLFMIVAAIAIYAVMFILMILPIMILGEGATSIIGLLMIVVYPIIILMSLALQGIMQYSVYLMTFSRLDGQSALKAGVQVFRKNMAATIIFVLVLFVVQIIGMLLCGVGILVAYPVIIISGYLFCNEIFRGEYSEGEDHIDATLDHLV